MARTRQAGFTLLEILVVLVVLGLLMVTLTQGLRFGIAAFQAQGRILEAHGDLDAVDRALRTLIEDMDPGDGLTGPPVFVGTARRLVFVTELPQSAAVSLPSRDAEVELVVDADHRLVLLWRSFYRTPLGPPSPPQRTVLLPDVERLELSYWRRPQTQVGAPRAQPGAWLDAWQDRRLPGLVRVRVVRAGPGHAMLPDIVAAPTRQPAQL